MRFLIALGIGICVLVSASTGRPSQRANHKNRTAVTFTDIANTKRSPFKLFRMTPDINNKGVVAFEAARKSDGGDDGLYTATGTDRFTTIVRSNRGPEFAGLSGVVSINKDGVVAFAAGPPYTRSAPHGQVYTLRKMRPTSKPSPAFKTIPTLKVSATR